MIDANDIQCLDGLSHKAVIVEEALFGYRHVKPYVDALPHGARLLEVGSGPCLLLATFAREYDALHVQGIEPVGPGFDLFKPAIERLQMRTSFDLFHGGYEDFKVTTPYDLIYAINVFEHVPDWRDCIGFFEKALKPGGKAVILCPNYGFPYESHFRLPMIGGKTLTYWLFKKTIHAFEDKHDVKGLWSSINGVSWRGVKKEMRHHPSLSVRFDPSILAAMIDRLSEDEAFAARQKTVGFIARLLKKTGLFSVFMKPLFFNRHPYMHLVFEKQR